MIKQIILVVCSERMFGKMMEKAFFIICPGEALEIVVAADKVVGRCRIGCRCRCGCRCR
jgi:hypothetical protein